MDDQPQYKFKWVNIDLEEYLDGMRFRAGELRRKARTLEAQADMIDEEREKLSTDLVLVKPADA